MDKNFIGERISELRLKKNVSEYQMSLDLGKNKSYIQSLTSGRSLPTMQSFLDICDYLEVTPQQFFDSELHNLPLIDKATDLMKQLDDEDMLALISMLNRLALKRNRFPWLPNQGSFYFYHFFLKFFNLKEKPPIP